MNSNKTNLKKKTSTKVEKDRESEACTPSTARSEGNKKEGTQAKRSEEVTESDAFILGVSIDSVNRPCRSVRKRKVPEEKIQDVESSSDQELAPAPTPPKVATTRRGRGRFTGLAAVVHRRVEREARAQEEDDAIELMTRTIVAERERSPLPTSLELSAAKIKKGVEGHIEALRLIMKKSKGLKGTTQKAFREIVDGLVSYHKMILDRTASQESRLLQLQNDRLTSEMSEMRKEMEALKRALKDARAPTIEVPSKNPPESEIEMVRREMAEFRASLSVIEGRILRPPLAADRRRESQLQPQPSSSYASVAASSSPCRALPGPRAPPAPRAPPVPRAPLAPQVTLPTPVAPASRVALVPRPTPAPRTKQTERGIAAPQPNVAPQAPILAGKRKRNGRKAATPQPQPEPQTAPAAPQNQWEAVGAKKKAAKKRRKATKKTMDVAKKLRPPRSTAVILTLQPAALERGTTYAELLKKARAVIKPEELGITTGLRCRTTQTGARLIEVPGATSGDQADKLADGLRSILPVEDVRVSRPQKSAEVRITGLDDSVDVEEVVASVARVGECSADQIRCGAIREGRAGNGTAIVSCPVAAAKRLADGRRLLVGWVSAQVRLLEPRPARCYRCFAHGHVGVKCTSQVDCSGRCFRCGQPGHMAGACSAAPHCILCAAAGKPAEHRAGSKACAAPKAKISPTTSARSQPRRPAGTVAAPVAEGAEVMETG